MIVQTFSRRLSHVAQRGHKDCAIAAAATVAQVTYEEAASQSPPHCLERGTYSNEMLEILRRLTAVKWRICFPWWRTVKQLKAYPYPIVLSIRNPDIHASGHYIAMDETWVHDPASRQRVAKDFYGRGDARIKAILRPKSLERYHELIAGRLNTRSRLPEIISDCLPRIPSEA
jgi:hypothetical protein